MDRTQTHRRTVAEPTAIIRQPEVSSRTGYSRPSLYRLEKEGRFPRRVKLGDRAAGWVAGEIEAWVQARIAARDGTD
jgi:prophage regulatory protein